MPAGRGDGDRRTTSRRVSGCEFPAESWRVPWRTYSLPPQDLVQRVLCDPLDVDNFQPVTRARHDAHPRSRDAEKVGEEADALIVGFPVDRRRGEVQLPRLTEAARNRRPPG